MWACMARVQSNSRQYFARLPADAGSVAVQWFFPPGQPGSSNAWIGLFRADAVVWGAGGSPTSAAAQKRLESTEYRARVHSHALQLRAQARAVLLVQKLVRRHLAKKRARAAAEQRARRPVQTRTLNS